MIRRTMSKISYTLSRGPSYGLVSDVDRADTVVDEGDGGVPRAGSLMS